MSIYTKEFQHMPLATTKLKNNFVKQDIKQFHIQENQAYSKQLLLRRKVMHTYSE